MFDWIEVENLDPRLVQVESGGKISVDKFADTLLVRSFSTSQDLVTQVFGDINFVNTDSRLSLVSTGDTIFFGSSYIPAFLDLVWVDNFYLRDNINFYSDREFLVSNEYPNSIRFSPNAVHTVKSLSGDLTVETEGNLSNFTDTSQRSISFTLGTISEEDIDTDSEIDSKILEVVGGIVVDDETHPDFTNAFYSGNYCIIQGVTGSEIVSPKLSELHTQKLLVSGSDIFENSGQLWLNNSLVSISGSLERTYFKPSISYTMSSGDYIFSSGTYRHSYVHNLGMFPLWITVDFLGRQRGFGRSFDKVLSYTEQQYYTAQIPSYASGITNNYLDLMANPDNLTGTYLTTYQSLIADIMSDHLTFPDNPSPYVSLTGAIVSLGPPKSVEYLNVVTGGYLSATGGMLLLTGLVAYKTGLYWATSELEKPQEIAYYVDFTSNSIDVYFKNPTSSLPSGAVRAILEFA